MLRTAHRPQRVAVPAVVCRVFPEGGPLDLKETSPEEPEHKSEHLRDKDFPHLSL